MIKIKVKYSASIVNRLAMLMLILGALALIALSVSTRIASDTKGSAYMINQLGLLRMKNYQLLSMVPLDQSQYNRLNLFADIPLSNEYLKLLEHYGLIDEFQQLQTQWQTNIAPKIKQATTIADIKEDINSYVTKIDKLVYAIDRKTESQISMIYQIQLWFIAVIILFLVIQIYYLRRHLLLPWKKLISMAESISTENLSERFVLRRKKDEFDLLGQAFNIMSEQIESHYQELEQKVAEKTAELRHKNQIVSFLYQATKQLHTSKPLCERFLLILHKLEQITPLNKFQIRFYESEDLEHYQDIGYDNTEKLPYCQNPSCSACLVPSKPYQKEEIQRYWYLQDSNEKYGLLFATLPVKQNLTDEQEHLITGLVEQMTMAIALDKQIEQQKQFLLMKERSAMARELHDSIAQSLSCLKIHISCLQMQSDLSSQESIDLLNKMRKEINVTYSQLRELITSFRLRINQVGFYASLQELITEFNIKLGFEIQLDYQLPLNLINSRYAIHLLQVIREALNNIYKHAKASQVIIQFHLQEHHIITLEIEDNGIGIKQDKSQKENHYGLIIMRDRAELLNANFTIESAPYKGTKIMLTFKENNQIPFTTITE